MKSFKSFIEEKTMAAAALGGIIGGVALGLAGSPQQKQEITQPQTQQTQQTQQASPKKTKPEAWRALISSSEGFRSKAYWDSTGKVWTIGKGSTTHPDGRPVTQTDSITAEQADEYMEHYVNKNLIPKLEKIPTWGKINDNQRGALISFGYNVGPNFYNSRGYETITKALSSEESLNNVPVALKLYNKSGGKVLPGLVKRRQAEGVLWGTPVD